MNLLVLLNGSPRGERSNTHKMLRRIAQGWERGGGNVAKIFHLAQPGEIARAIQDFETCQAMVLGMPLYTDSMPALVLDFLDAWMPVALDRKRAGTMPMLGFLVQSGFPEALHSRPLERYWKKLATRLEANYAGTIVRGSGESLQAMPDIACKKLWEQLQSLGEQLAGGQSFSPEILRRIAGRERFSGGMALLMRFVIRLPMAQFYWRSMMKKNGTRKCHSAASYGHPYQP
jgi:hypothetical protein